MKMYTVTASVVALVAGVLLLTLAQAAPRQHCLQVLREPKRGKDGKVKPDERGEFRVVAPVQFKQGETFGYDGDVSKALADCLTDAAEAERAAREAREAAERAEAAQWDAGLRTGLLIAALNACTKFKGVNNDPMLVAELAGFVPTEEELARAIEASTPVAAPGT